MSQQKRPLNEDHTGFTNLEEAMGFWLSALIGGPLDPQTIENLKYDMRVLYDAAHTEGYLSGIRMVKNVVKDIRES